VASLCGAAPTRSVGEVEIAAGPEMSVKRLALNMEEWLPGLLEPHTVLPVQFFSRAHCNPAWSGEQCLMAAMLEDAIAIYLRPAPPRTSQARHVSREARRWLRSNNRSWVFSFLRICEALDLDPNAIRQRLRSLRGDGSPPSPGDTDVLRSTEPTRRAASG
jgi:hypothetical protein